MYNIPANFIDEQKIWEILEENKKPDFVKVKEVLSKAREMKGIKHG
jgi:2-iminoacetate synthase